MGHCAVPPVYMERAPMEVDAPRHPVGAIHSDEQLMAVTKERNKLRDQVCSSSLYQDRTGSKN